MGRPNGLPPRTANLLTRTVSYYSLLLLLFQGCTGQLVLMDFADGTTNATTPFSFPVMTETCGDAFNKYVTLPFNARENQEVGRLVDYDGGPGWGPFSIIGGNEQGHFRIDHEGKVRILVPFFDPSATEFNLRLASMNGNLMCTVKIAIKLAGNLSASDAVPLNHTLEDNMIFQSELRTSIVPSTIATTAATTTRLLTTLNSTSTTAVMPNASHSMANIMSSTSTKSLLDDDSFRVDEILMDKNSSRKQGAFFPGGAVFPLGPRCTDPFMTVAVPSDTPVNTPIAKVTATYQLDTPIQYTTTDVVFDRFRVDPFTGIVYLGPEALTARNRLPGRIIPQTRSALEFRVRATVPSGQYCETVIRVNVVGSDNTLSPTPGRQPPVFTSQYQAFTVSNCEPGSPIGRVEARGNSPGDRIQYVIDNPSSEVYVDLDSGVLRVGNLVPEPRVRQVIVRAIDSYGSSTTLPVTVDFHCRGSPSFPIGQLVFEQPVYQFMVTICNVGTPVGVVRLIGSPGGVEYSLTAWQEFTIDPNGLIQLRAFQPSDNPERRFAVFASDPYGNRGQVPVTVLLQCGLPPGVFPPGPGGLGGFPPNPSPFQPSNIIDNRPLGQPGQNLLGVNPDLFDPRGTANSQPAGGAGPFGPGPQGFPEPFNGNLGSNLNSGFPAPNGPFPPNSPPNGNNSPLNGFPPSFENRPGIFPGNNLGPPPPPPGFPGGPGFGPSGPGFGPGPFQPMPFPNRDLPQNSLSSQPDRVSQTFSFELPPLVDPITKQVSTDHSSRPRPSRPLMLGDPNNLNHLEDIAARLINHTDIEDPNNLRSVSTIAPKQLQVHPTKQPSSTNSPPQSNDQQIPMTVKTSILFPHRMVVQPPMFLQQSSQNAFHSRQLNFPGPQDFSPLMFGPPFPQLSAGSERQVRELFGGPGSLFETPFMGQRNFPRQEQNFGARPINQDGTGSSDELQVPSRQMPFQGSSSSGLPEPIPGVDANGQKSDDAFLMSPPGFGGPMGMSVPGSFPGPPPGPPVMFPFELPGRNIAGPPGMTQFTHFPAPLPQQLQPSFPIASGPSFGPFGPAGPDVGRMPDFTMRLPHTAGQTPPIFVTPLCAPPNTNFIGRVKAVAPDPMDRVTYFMYSSGGSDLFFVNEINGEIRSRTALTIGTYVFDVAARDFSGRTAIMKLEVAITPSCSRPQMMDFQPDGSRFPSRALSPSRNLGLGPRFGQDLYDFTIPSVLTSSTRIGQVQAVSDMGNIVRYSVSPSDDFRIDADGNIFAAKPVRTAQKMMVTAMDSTGRGTSASVNIAPSSTRPGSKPCDEARVSRDDTIAGNITHTFTKASQQSKPLVNINGPTTITVDTPLGGNFPPVLLARTILGEYIVTGGSGTYRWLNSEEA
ncbi:hypothetical protein RvY_15757 [Ramazzottius varieornatus]|uniref:Cadherin prodomain domain-containing protein n=1 Tax=Ramazzottius varieornatus TaxID=947166 RepID=A0A1D1VW19_RAMVA|nr:hypothetical protein RvY_15757 [Ramazzottius varieornatus]